eukprot:scaffold1049_cov152-Skeletonema_menzelii.AAC.14
MGNETVASSEPPIIPMVPSKEAFRRNEEASRLVRQKEVMMGDLGRHKYQISETITKLYERCDKLAPAEKSENILWGEGRNEGKAQ